MGDNGFTLDFGRSQYDTYDASRHVCFRLRIHCCSPFSALDDAYRSKFVVFLLIGYFLSYIGLLFMHCIVPGSHLDYGISVV